VSKIRQQPSSSSLVLQGPGWLAETLTQDGLRLKGFWLPLDCSTAPSRELWLIIHGVSGNFYDSSLLNFLSAKLTATGRDVLLVNTRGHDPLAYISTNGGMTRIGAAYEMLDDAKLDLRAWLEWSRLAGYEKVTLLGHSLGAVKVAFYVADAIKLDEPSTIQGAVCISPPRLNAALLAEDESYGDIYESQLREAQRLWEAGKPESLMYVRFPQPMHISAATFLDKYGSEKFDYLIAADKIGCQTLWTFGDFEVRGKRSNFRDCEAVLAEKLVGKSWHRISIIERADHNYTQNRDGLFAALKYWMDDCRASV
jgi:predicted alpha/beta-fold hydrolase